MRLCLQPDPHILDWIRERSVGDSGECSSEVVFWEGETGAGWAVGFEGLEVTTRKVEGAELDRDAGADAEEGGERAFVEGEGAFVLDDVGGAGEGVEGDGRGLEADFDDI